MTNAAIMLELYLQELGIMRLNTGTIWINVTSIGNKLDVRDKSSSGTSKV